MNKKVPIIIICILAILIIIVLFYSQTQNKAVEEAKYLILGEQTLWKYENNTWQSESPSSFDSSTKMLVYINEGYQGIYKAEYVNSWNFLTNESKYLNYDDNILATTQNLVNNIERITNEECLQSDVNFINELTSKSYSDLSNITCSKYSVDLNNDGIKDYLISANNFIEEQTNSYFNLLYTNINGTRTIIKKNNIEPKNALLNPTYHLYSVIKLNDQKTPNLIFKKAYFSNVHKPSFVMYQSNNQKYEVVVED